MNKEALASFGPQLHRKKKCGGTLRSQTGNLSKYLNCSRLSPYHSVNITLQDSFSSLDDLISYRIRVIASMFSSHLKISLVIHVVIAECVEIKV
jgi:hypothetical protein